MVKNSYTRAVEEINMSQESLSRTLSAVREAEEHPTEALAPGKKKWKKILLIAAAIIVLLNIGVGTASAIMGVNLYYETYRFFDESINPKYVESYEDIEATSNDIKVVVTDAISDGYNTIIRLDIDDPNLKLNMEEDDYFAGSMGVGGAELYDEFGNRYEWSGGSGAGLGSGEAEAMVLNFEGGPEFPCEMHLFITSINGNRGGWDMTFTVTPHLEAKKYTCNTVFEFDNGTKMRIDTVEQYITRTIIRGTYLKAPDFMNCKSRDVQLYIGDNVYGFRSIESSELDFKITLEAIEENIIEPELSISFGNEDIRDTETKRMKNMETKRMKLNLTKK